MDTYIVVPPTKCPRLVAGSCITGHVVVIDGREWTVETDGDTNLYLSELAGLPVLGYAQSLVADNREFMPVWKNWQALAMVHKWNLCPRCGGHIPDSVNIGKHEGALSRWDNKTYVCTACGVEEAMLQAEGVDIAPNGPHGWVDKEK